MKQRASRFLRSRRALVAMVLSTLLLSSPSPSQAMHFDVKGSSVVMSGSVAKSDCATLEETLAQNRKIGTVILTDSGGGDASAGYCVGGLIRQRGLSTVIRGRCASSCSRMWLGGVERSLEGPNSRVGLHGNYSANGGLLAEAPGKLRAWITEHAPAVDRELMERWIHLPTNKSMMYFYNGKAELCENRSCTRLEGRTALNAGLSTR